MRRAIEPEIVAEAHDSLRVGVPPQHEDHGIAEHRLHQEEDERRQEEDGEAHRGDATYEEAAHQPLPSGRAGSGPSGRGPGPPSPARRPYLSSQSSRKRGTRSGIQRQFWTLPLMTAKSAV